MTLNVSNQKKYSDTFNWENPEFRNVFFNHPLTLHQGDLNKDQYTRTFTRCTTQKENSDNINRNQQGIGLIKLFEQLFHSKVASIPFIFYFYFRFNMFQQKMYCALCMQGYVIVYLVIFETRVIYTGYRSFENIVFFSKRKIVFIGYNRYYKMFNTNLFLYLIII